ncbi:MAG: hypothetical protein K6F69_10035 [Treponema sp.]|nr:hypothetical protein [Treponema sp.]
MADGKVEFDTRINTDNLKNDTDKVKNTIKKTTADVEKTTKKTTENIKKTTDNAAKKIDKSVSSTLDKLKDKIEKLADNKLLNTLSKIGSTVTGVQSAFSVATDVISTTVSVVNDLANAYNVQATAETQLAQAVKNNPYLNDTSVQELKNYASQMQELGNVGDETILPLMAQLASAGRTQEEIQDIISASLDVAASGTMEFESAVKNLNKTFGGYAGELGETNPLIKALTTEELQNGKAVEIMKSQYAGMYKSTSNAVAQFNNSFGDLKETAGKYLTPIQIGFTKIAKIITDTVNKGLTAYYSAIENIGDKLNELITNSQFNNRYNESLQNLHKSLIDINDEAERYVAIASATRNLDFEERNLYINKLKSTENRSALEDELLNILQQQKQAHEENLKIVEEMRKATFEKQEAEKAVAEEQQHQQDIFKQYYTDVVEAKKKEIEMRKKAGETITEETELQELSITKLQAYLQYLLNGGKENNDIMNEIAKTYERLKAISIEDTAKNAKANYDTTLKSLNDEIKYRETLGDVLTDEEKTRQKLNTIESAYLEMRKAAGFSISDENSKVKEIINTINKLREKLGNYDFLKDISAGFNDSAKSYIESVNNLGVKDEKLSTIIDKSIQALESSAYSFCKSAFSFSRFSS